jgi:rfaE bifunctional protein nucleotidyltransferase chain/domain
MGVDKIFTRAGKLKSVTDLLKSQHKKIVFTNGCFDILHAGHVLFLEEAKMAGDYLIVAVNNNDSVTKLKGPQRPIMDENDRLLVLSALESVDAVILFKEDTPEKLIKFLLPDVLIKGADYKPELIVGYDTVINNGGSVETVSFKKDISTSKIVNKIIET